MSEAEETGIATADERGWTPIGIPEKTLELGVRVASLAAPPPRLTVSEWADGRRILPETSPAPGQWRTSHAEYTRRAMDVVSAGVKRLVLKWASQLGKSEVLLNILGYFIDHDPAPCMMVQPTKEKAQHFSKRRLAPMLRDSPALRTKVRESKSRDSGNTITLKEFAGGFLVLVGSNAPSDLASWPVRVLVLDELDRFEKSAGKEGDPLELAEKRLSRFWNRVEIIVSSPSAKGESRIQEAYEQSTQEVWCVPCPSCGCYQPYEWDRLDFETESMACVACGAMHDEFEWHAGDCAGEWIAREESETIGLGDLDSMACPDLRWHDLIKEWREAVHSGSLERLQVQINTRRCELWEGPGEEIEPALFDTRRHYYDCDVPAGVLLLTAGVDVQGDRLELEIRGWGYRYENWGIHYATIPGDPHMQSTWDALDQELLRAWQRSDGRKMPIWCTCVDSGFATTEVYAFCKPRLARRVFATKGMGSPGLPIVGKGRRAGKNANILLVPIGTNTAKDTVASRLAIEQEGAGYCHFPKETALSDGESPRGYDEVYFAGLTAERRVPHRIQGRTIHQWEQKKHRPNEAFDLAVLNLVALELVNPDWDAWQAQMGTGETRGRGDAETRRPSRWRSRGVEV